MPIYVTQFQHLHRRQSACDRRPTAGCSVHGEVHFVRCHSRAVGRCQLGAAVVQQRCTVVPCTQIPYTYLYMFAHMRAHVCCAQSLSIRAGCMYTAASTCQHVRRPTATPYTYIGLPGACSPNTQYTTLIPRACASHATSLEDVVVATCPGLSKRSDHAGVNASGAKAASGQANA